MARIERPMSRFEEERLHLKMLAILRRVGVLCRRNANCAKCKKVYEKFDALLNRPR